jgi:glutathione S-transferase
VELDHLLGSQRFLAGDRLSIADLVLRRNQIFRTNA